MFKSDKQYVPQNASYSYTTKLDGKYLDDVRECLNNNDAVRYAFVKWIDGEHPVLAVAPITEGARRGSGNSRDDRGYSSRGTRGASDRNSGAASRGVRGRSIENDPDDDARSERGADPADEGGEETPGDENWDK